MASGTVIVDCGTGNLASVKRGFARVGADCLISSKRVDIEHCERLVLAGVGHFRSAMDGLERLDLIEPLENAVLIKKKPVLGICLGMQLMAKRSEEGSLNGLGWIDGEVIRLKIADELRYKVPQIGWNQTVQKKTESRLMKQIPNLSEFYFLHSYRLKLNAAADELLETTYETAFSSAVEKGNIFGVQFHPEKSRQIGLQLLKNFAEL